MKRVVSFKDFSVNLIQVLDYMNDAVLLMKGMVFIDCNQKAIDLYGGSSREDIINYKPYEFSPKYQPEELESKREAEKRVRAALKGTPQFFEWKHSKLNGELIDTEVSLNLVRVNKKKFLLAIVRDITERKRTEKIKNVIINILSASSETATLEELLEIIRKELNLLMPAENFFIALTVDKERGLYRIPFITDIHKEEIVEPEERLDLKGGYTDYVVQNEKPLLANREKIRELTESKKMRLIGTDSNSWLGVPLRMKKKGVAGALVLQDYRVHEAYRPEDLTVLNSIAPTICSVIIEKELKEKVKKSEERFRNLFENIPDAAFLTRLGGENHGEILIANTAAERQTGYRRGELIGMNISRLLPSERYKNGISDNRKKLLDEGKQIQFEEVKRRKDGSKLISEVSLTKISSMNEEYAISINRDISGRKKTEKKLFKANRLLETFSRVNHVTANIDNRKDLFKEICDISVNVGGFLLAWIGIVFPEKKIVKPVAFSGKHSDYLKDIEISIEKNIRGTGPTGRSVREKESVVFNDLKNNPDYKFWRTNAIKRGFYSSGSFPIILNENVIGTLNVYSGEPDYFDKEEIKLLEDMVVDISAALLRFSEEEKRVKAEQELLKLKEGLEEQVRMKTAELNEKIDDLERFHDATIEREFRIEDLNKKIKKLEGELKLYKN